MRIERANCRAIRRRLLARASTLALRVALRPRGWASRLLMVGVIGASAAALAGETILTTDAELIIQGGAPDDRAGGSISVAGDVNGDGIDDLIIGAPSASPNGRTGAGASYVVFGAANGLPPIIDLATEADVTIQGAAAGEYCCTSVSGAGDVNGDGIDDLIIGAPSASPNDRARAGASYVVFGSLDLSGTIDLADTANGADLIIEGALDGDRSGYSVSGAGDVNGDGIDDLIVGASGADPNGHDYAGASYVIFGDADGFPATVDLASEADVIIQGAHRSDESGRSVSGAGDVNGDGVDDLIIGAVGASPPNRRGAGISYVIFGSDQGLPAIIHLATDADVVIQGAAAFDRSGLPVSGAGDVNGDGIDDLLIGAALASPKGRDNAGAAYVVFGTDSGLPATIDLKNEADVVIQGAMAGDLSGSSVSGAGDVSGDGIDDLIIGAQLAGPAGRTFAGASYVVFGADRGLPATIDLKRDADLTIQGSEAYDESGRSVSGGGDLNGDGIDDLAIGASGAGSHAGAGYVVFGGPAAALERLIAEIEAAELPRRVMNRLTRKLEKALKDVNDGKIIHATLRLEAFDRKVAAHRGKAIDEADAGEWIADAEAISDMLRAQLRALQHLALSSLAKAP